MNSQAVFQDKKRARQGFTLIEILIVLGIVALLAGMVVIANTRQYTRQVSSSEVSTLVSLLQSARNRAMNNIDAKAHGVYLADPNDYVAFYGNTYDPSKEENRIPKGKDATISGLDGDPAKDEVVFDQLSGNTTNIGVITVTNTMEQKEVTINKMGLIIW